MARDGVDRVFLALADRTRRGVVDLLRERPHRAGELATRLGVSAPALSRHLRILRGSGLVATKAEAEDARVCVYTLKRGSFARLRAWIDGIESLWTENLAAFAAHVARRESHGAGRNRSS